ncbi:MAG: 3'-5' exonuclease [Peptococcaceae bacterium]|nr:3'-5' exonuclease [Peptococcaceae bacterium]
MYRIKKLFQLDWFYKSTEERHSGKTTGRLDRFRHRSGFRSNFPDPELPLREMTLVVLDTETTGFKPQSGDEIISIGACLIKDGKILPQTFNRLVNPGRPIPPFITELTGISNEMVANAEDFYSVAASFLDFLKDRIIIGHSIEFDLNFLNYKLKSQGVRIKNPNIDTGVISGALYPDLRMHTLDSILSRMKIDPEGRHTALGDALLTAGVFLNYNKILEERGILNLSELRCFLINAALLKI